MNLLYLLIREIKITLLIIIFATATSCSSDNANYQNNRVPVAPYYAPNSNPYYYQNPPSVQRGYGGGYQYPPASRYYSNPYEFPPQNNYPYYDSDQYYVPPRSYGSNDYDNNNNVFEKF